MDKHSNYTVYNTIIAFMVKLWDCTVNVTGTGRVTLCVQGIGPVFSGFSNRLDQGGCAFTKKPITAVIGSLVANGVTHIKQAKKGNYYLLPNCPKDSLKAVLLAITPCLPATASKVSSDYIDAFLADYIPQQAVAKTSSKPVDVTATPKAVAPVQPVIITPSSNKRTDDDIDRMRTAAGLQLQPVNVPTGLKPAKDKAVTPVKAKGKDKNKKSGKATKK